MPQPPDIVLLGADWRSRALIRAQLIEEGFEVVATDSWPTMRRHLRPGAKPRLAIVDLQGLPDPAGVLKGLRALMQPDRVLVLSALGTVDPADIQRLGFDCIARPVAMKDLVTKTAQAMRSVAPEGPD